MLVLLVIIIGWAVGIGGYAYHRDLNDRFTTLERDLIESIEGTHRVLDRRVDDVATDVRDIRKDLDAAQIAVAGVV